MKILHVISDRNVGGAGILLLNLLRHFDRTRVESLVALPRGSALRERILGLGVVCYELSNDCDVADFASVREIARLIRISKIDLVHANAALSARIAGRLCRVRVVHTRHCCFPQKTRGALLQAILRRCNASLSDRVIATATAAADDLLALGIPMEKIKVIINGSDPVREVGEAELDAARAAFGIDKSAFCVGICARLVACKGHSTLLHAAREVLDTSPSPIVFLIAGDGPERERLQSEARDLGIADYVRFLGFLNDTAPFYRLLDLNVNCSVGTETSCLAISEGMSAGVPALATDYGGNPAMVEEGTSGFLFPQNDSHALANLILRIQSNRSLLNSLRHGALLRYQAHFTAERMTRQTTRVYEEIL